VRIRSPDTHVGSTSAYGTQDGRFPAVRTGPRRDRKPRYPHDRWTGAGRYLLVVLTEAMDGRDYEVTVRDRCLAPDLRTQGKVKQVSKQDEKDHPEG
jgi:hypothetical protein